MCRGGGRSRALQQGRCGLPMGHKAEGGQSSPYGKATRQHLWLGQWGGMSLAWDTCESEPVGHTGELGRRTQALGLLQPVNRELCARLACWVYSYICVARNHGKWRTCVFSTADFFSRNSVSENLGMHHETMLCAVRTGYGVQDHTCHCLLAYLSRVLVTLVLRHLRC